MANTYFSFKEFTVHQDKTAMKVCTDACLFGAWAVQQIQKYKHVVSNILDIGTGTGLLSLMLAQKFVVATDAIEINGDAAAQATENFLASPWKNLEVHHTALSDFNPDTRYDFVISNPPFYEGDLLSPDSDRNTAMHDSYLTLDSLLDSIESFLDENGLAAVLLPFSRISYFKETLVKNNLHVVEITMVRQTASHNYFRVMVLLSKNRQVDPGSSELSIYDDNKQYTPAFTALLKDYYLAF